MRGGLSWLGEFARERESGLPWACLQPYDTTYRGGAGAGLAKGETGGGWEVIALR
jgi:hypothetical protein